MKSLTEFIQESNLLQACKEAQEEKKQIKLPYTFDIYNKGAKNVNFKFTKAAIHRIFFSIDNDHLDQMIECPLLPEKICYSKFPDKKNTKDWTEVPEVRDYMLCGAWYSNKYVEYNYNRYNRDWEEFLTDLFKRFKGKVSVTIDVHETDLGWTTEKRLFITVNDDKFNKEREEKVKELSDTSNLKKWEDEATAKEKKEIEDRRKQEEENERAAKEWEEWWNSLSPGQKASYERGYGQGRYQGD